MSRYHIAHLLIESAGKKRVKDLAAKHGLTEDEIRAMADFDPTKTDKFLGWIAAQAAAGELSIPANGPELKILLEDFGRKGKLIGEPDINKWTFGGLKEKLSATESKGEIERTRAGEGQRVFLDEPPWKIVEVTTPEAASKLFRPEWCIKDKKFWDQYGCSARAPAYLVLKNGKKYATMVPHEDELKDIKDKPLKPTAKFAKLLERLGQLIKIEWVGDFAPFRLLIIPIDDVIQDPMLAFEYARDIIKGRWPKGEAAIAHHSEAAGAYALTVVKGRWPEGEVAIAKDPTEAYIYAKIVLKKRFPEGEPVIASNPESAYLYAKDVIKGRFPKGEAAIASNSESAYLYAKDVIKGRFQKGEGAIARRMHYSIMYSKIIGYNFG